MKPSMFIQLEDIEGESMDGDHTDWIDVVSWSWGASISTHAVLGSGRSVGQGRVTTFDFTKYIDKASPALAHSTVVGKHIHSAEFHATKSGDAGQALVYVKFQFREVIIKSYRTGDKLHNEEPPTEHISLDFEDMKFQYIEQDSSGSSMSKPEMRWDAIHGRGSIS